MDYDWFETAKRIAGKDAKVPKILLENNPIEIRHVRINTILNANTTPHETAGDFVKYIFEFCFEHNVDLNLVCKQYVERLEREDLIANVGIMKRKLFDQLDNAKQKEKNDKARNKK